MLPQKRAIYYVGPDAPNEHPRAVVKRLSDELSFKVVWSVPQSIADQWWFWIEFEVEPELPKFMRYADWLPVGTV